MKCQQCKEVDIEEPEFCCSGWMCGCMGLPIDPPFCKECWELVLAQSALESDRTT